MFMKNDSKFAKTSNWVQRRKWINNIGGNQNDNSKFRCNDGKKKNFINRISIKNRNYSCKFIYIKNK